MTHLKAFLSENIFVYSFNGCLFLYVYLPIKDMLVWNQRKLGQIQFNLLDGLGLLCSKRSWYLHPWKPRDSSHSRGRKSDENFPKSSIFPPRQCPKVSEVVLSLNSKKSEGINWNMDREPSNLTRTEHAWLTSKYLCFLILFTKFLIVEYYFMWLNVASVGISCFSIYLRKYSNYQIKKLIACTIARNVQFGFRIHKFPSRIIQSRRGWWLFTQDSCLQKNAVQSRL